MQEPDGRSYRSAVRRSQAQEKLSDQTVTFRSGDYQRPAPAEPDRGGDYWQYRDNTPAPAPQPTLQPTAGRQPAPAGQGGRPPQVPGRGQELGRADQPGFAPERPGDAGPRPGRHSEVYEAPQPQRSQQRPAQTPPINARPAPAPMPAPAPAPAPVPVGAPAVNRPAGQNPYDEAVTGAYPYSVESFLSPPTPPGPLPDSAEDAYYRPSAPERQPAGSRPGQGEPGYASGGYPAAPGYTRY
jgi:hypothetical protein